MSEDESDLPLDSDDSDIEPFCEADKVFERVRTLLPKMQRTLPRSVVDALTFTCPSLGVVETNRNVFRNEPIAKAAGDGGEGVETPENGKQKVLVGVKPTEFVAEQAVLEPQPTIEISKEDLAKYDSMIESYRKKVRNLVESPFVGISKAFKKKRGVEGALYAAAASLHGLPPPFYDPQFFWQDYCNGRMTVSKLAGMCPREKQTIFRDRLWNRLRYMHPALGDKVMDMLLERQDAEIIEMIYDYDIFQAYASKCMSDLYASGFYDKRKADVDPQGKV